MAPLRIGTRKSRLALWQANYVAGHLRALAGERGLELVEIETAGDQVRDIPLSRIGGDGVFTREIQKALLAGTVDVAVHSLKDLPTLKVDGLILGAVPPRGPTGDVFLSRKHTSFDRLPPGAAVATGSIRRQAQALERRPDLNVIGIRGNVETRLRKLADPNLDGLILAQAGLDRLGLTEETMEALTWMLPAVGQGALGLECRAEDADTRALLRHLDHSPTFQAVLAERSFLWNLGGGCLAPIGVVSHLSHESLTLRGAVLAPDGSRRVEGQLDGSIHEPEEMGRKLALNLLARGAGKLLDDAR